MAPVCALIGICMAAYLGSWVLKQDPGPDKMNSISIKIQQGAKAFLMSEYKLLVIFMVVVGIIMAVALSPITALAFATGGVMSAAAGYAGMHVATRANTRTAHAAEQSVAKALNVSFKSGLTMGLCVASFALLGLSLWLLLLVFGIDIVEVAQMHENIGMVEGFATGASAVALFARVGGGIYTKAADVGADLVGKVEAGIPEDDPRNPATIADNVGDNVGDVAGMGADLFESYTGAILAPTILAATFGALGGYFATGDLVWALVTPVIIAGCGILTSIIGLFAVRAKEGAALHKALNRGTYVAAGIEIVVIFCLFFIWNSQSVEAQPLWLFGSVLCGLVAGLAIGKITEYFCSDKYKPVHKIADAADTGAATVIIEGIGTGMLSTIAPIVLVALAIIGAYTFGNMAFPNAAADGGIAVGLFGVGLAATGMLSNTAITIGVDAYGPVADNAGGIAEMAGLPEEVRDRTDALDAVGNTTAAIAKGFAIASAGLSAISLFVSYQATMHHSIPDFALTLTDPLIVAGIFIGAMMPFMFAALTMGAVSRAAHAMVEEVRRQFREIKGIMEYKAEPEYDKCVAISTSSALREMMLPGCLAIVVPVLIGCFNPAMLGGFLAGAVATGMLMAIFMSNAGGAWDNAKKYIEQGHHGGKGSEAHKAAVVGDTVGDPFKDTSGPSMNILINLMTIVSLTFAPLFIMLQGMF
ncbi:MULTISPECIES: sodium-translocating pyrophosphatase [Eggerthella]|nr:MULTISPECIES: sodium-translocating pyrophosphatase [Eggerthella]MCB6527230.1 sodium-translocating pyrophosphatase [Eggerthella lenta]MCG4877289.1 sodium-translocating pyrophosphatase [Eggerthella lenta]MCQ5240482.1 sodium-translocating pyrophosphatase [Eggerthella lenta]MDB1740959.1 sodium-translocating pyrophosphatase [Eggerthella lenta]MDB1743910.1 sodium-translocating pyrophosphatase [Eggerthella lenta]